MNRRELLLRPVKSSWRAAMSGLAAAIISPAALADHPSLVFGSATGGPVRTISAATLPMAATSVGLETEYIKSRAFSDETLAQAAADHIHAHSVDALVSTKAGIAYGVTEDFTLGVSLPYVQRRNIRAGAHRHEGGEVVNEAETHGDSGGGGDISLMGKYRLRHNRQDNQALSLLFGVKLPTGSTRETDREGARFETHYQPGSGSWDPMVGMAVSRRAGEKAALNASVLYVNATRGAQATNLGDRVAYGVAASRRIAGGEEHSHPDNEAVQPHSHAAAPGAWDAVLEVNGEWWQRQKVAGREDANSGGHIVYLSPGLRYTATQNWTGHVSLGLPVYQNLNGFQSETDARLIAGVSRGF